MRLASKFLSLVIALVALFAPTSWGIETVQAAAAVGRDPAGWPFDARSPWNSAIGSGAVFEPETSVGWDVSLGGYANIESYSVPAYIADSSDPVRNIYRRRKNVSGVNVDLGRPGELWKQAPVPDAATPALGVDGHLDIVHPDRAVVFELFRAERLSNRDITALDAVSTDLRSDGLARGSTTAAQISSLGGMIRRGELTNGSGDLGTGIRHALNGILPAPGLNRYSPLGYQYPTWPWNAHVWPANSSDVPKNYATTGNVFMGSLLAIPPWVDITSLGIDDPQALEVARAMQDYGIYITDTGNTSGRLVIRIDPQAALDIRNRTTFQAGIGRAMRALQVVTNSHDKGARPAWGPGGGGTPRRPLAPSLSTAVHPEGRVLASTPKHLPGSTTLLVASAIGLRLTRRRRQG